MTNLDVVDIDGAVDMASTLAIGDAVTFAKSTNGDYKTKIYNANAGTATEANIYITNSSSDADGLFAGVGGTSFTTASGFVQDGAWIGSGSGASGGLSIMTRANADMRFYTNGHTNLAMTIDSSQRVGIGETSPSERLHIGGDFADYRIYSRTGIENGTVAFNEYFNGSAWANDDSDIVSGSMRFSDSRDSLEFGVRAGGSGAGYSSTHMTIKSTGNVGIGHTSPQYGLTMAQGNADGQKIGWEDGGNNKRGAIVVNDNTDAMEFMTGTADALRMSITSNGHLEPGSNNAYNLGSASLRWSVVFTSNSVNVSDETLKTDIQDCDLGIDFINTLKPKSFKMKDLKEKHSDYDKKHYGLIAQDLKDGKFKDSVYGDKDGEYGLAYNDLIAPMIKAIQELSAQNDLLTARIEALEA